MTLITPFGIGIIKFDYSNMTILDFENFQRLIPGPWCDFLKNLAAYSPAREAFFECENAKTLSVWKVCDYFRITRGGRGIHLLIYNGMKIS